MLSKKYYSRTALVVSVPLSYYLTQKYAGYGFIAVMKSLFSLRGILSLCLYALCACLFYLIFHRTKFAAIATILFGSVLGLANYFLMSFRGIPLMLADLFSIGTAQDVAAHYEYTICGDALFALILTIAAVILTAILKNYPGLSLKNTLIFWGVTVICGGAFYGIVFSGDFLEKHQIGINAWEMDRDYFSNGSLLSFVISARKYQIEKPKGYTAELVRKIAEQYENDPAENITGRNENDSAENRTEQYESDVRKPNVIVIMNESFSDLQVVGDIPMSEDCMPFIHSLKENTVKGQMLVSVVGGNTANTEFEYQTGCSMAFMPFRSIPYDSYIKSPVPSQVRSMKENGYAGNVGFHPGQPTAWSRDEVYDHFGFDQICFRTDMKEPETFRGFVSDADDFHFLIEKYEETRKTTDQPFYAFNVTIQNHGGYSQAMGTIDTPIRITDEGLKDAEAEQYLNLVKLSDRAFEELITYFIEKEEPTVIVMFGDHQPAFQTDFFARLEKEKDPEFDVEKAALRYTVPYLIWSNYELPVRESNYHGQEKQAVDSDGSTNERENTFGPTLSANYLAAYVTDLIGGPLSGYQKYLLDLMKEVPEINANGYRGADGQFYDMTEESEYKERLWEYQCIQYNNLFDTDNRVESFYR